MKMSKNVFQLMACLPLIGGAPALACVTPVLAAQISSSSSSSSTVNLGAKYSSDQTVVTIRPQDSQDVKSVKLNVYQATASAVKGQNEKYTMKHNDNSWTYTLPGDWKGTCYNFTIHYKDGSSKTETDPFGTALTQNEHFSVIGESGEQANPSVSTSSTSVIDAQSSSSSSSASSVSDKTTVSSSTSSVQSSAKNSSVSDNSNSSTSQFSADDKAKINNSSDKVSKTNEDGVTSGGVTPATNKEAAVGNGGATPKDNGDNGKGGNDKAVAVGSSSSSSSVDSSTSSLNNDGVNNGTNNDVNSSSSSSQSTLPQTGTNESSVAQWGTIGVGALLASGLVAVPTLTDRKRK